MGTELMAVTGETFGIRDELGKLGGRWDEAGSCWFVPSANHARAQALADDETRRVRPVRWMAYVNTLTWAKGSLAESCFHAALRGGSLGIGTAEIEAECATRIAAAGAPVKPERIRRDVRRGIEASGGADVELAVVGGYKKAPVAPVQAPVMKPKFQPSALSKFAGTWAARATRLFLADHSPVDVLGCNADDFLKALYVVGERVVVFDVFESQGSWMWSHDGGFAPSRVDFTRWAGEDARRENAPPMKPGGPEFSGRGPSGIWYLCNPVDGLFHKLGEQDDKGREKWSRRAKEAVTAWRYFVLESDEADAREWMGAIVQLPLPIAAIYTSGGKSVHVLVRVDAKSKAHFDEMREMAIATFVVLGADRGAMSAVRLTRLPFCWRLADKDGQPYAAPREQKLLYLDPAAGYAAIAERPRVRDSIAEALRAPYAEAKDRLARLGRCELVTEAKHELERRQP